MIWILDNGVLEKWRGREKKGMLQLDVLFINVEMMFWPNNQGFRMLGKVSEFDLHYNQLGGFLVFPLVELSKLNWENFSDSRTPIQPYIIIK